MKNTKIQMFIDTHRSTFAYHLPAGMKGTTFANWKDRNAALIIRQNTYFLR